MIELRKKGVLKIAVSSFFICLFILALVYPMIFARYRGKIHFLMCPNPAASFSLPSDEADMMLVWVSVIKDSTYGRCTIVLVRYMTYSDDTYYECHWYTDKLKAGETFAYLWATYVDPQAVWEYDVSVAKIDVARSEHQLNATVIVKGKTLFTVGFWANTSVPIESSIEMEEPQELMLSVEAYRPLLDASVTGLEVGDFLGGRFDYIDTELLDSSLLP